MTQSFKDMLCLLGAGAQGRKVSFQHKPNIEEIRKLSLLQGVWPIVYIALKKVFPDDEEVRKYNQETVGHMALNIQRTAFVRKIINELEDNGISCCVLKGEALSHLYHQPYSRISSDYDVLIDEAYEEKASQILKNRGYTVQARPKNHQHFQAMHPVGGLLEIHVKMYGDATRDILLSGMVDYNEPFVSIKTDDVEIKTLGLNDNMMFLTAHCLKHFLTGEVTIRQMLDLLLYMQKYKEECNTSAYAETLSKLKLTTFVSTLEGVGKMHFEIDTDAEFDEMLVNQLLDDIEQIMQGKTDANIHAKVSKAKYSKTGNYYLYESKHRYGGNKIFPDKEYLIVGGYKYARSTALIPVAWCHRLIKSLFTRPDKNKGIKNNSRMKLAKELGLY